MKGWQVWVGNDDNPEVHDFYVEAENEEKMRERVDQFLLEMPGMKITRIEEIKEQDQ